MCLKYPVLDHVYVVSINTLGILCNLFVENLLFKGGKGSKNSLITSLMALIPGTCKKKIQMVSQSEREELVPTP